MWISEVLKALNDISPYGLIALALLVALVAVAKM
jgi:hypothetical protein